MYFDTHAHYDDPQFDPDRDKLLSSMPENGMELILNPGSDGDSSAMAVALAGKYPFMYAAVGWHPQEAEKFGPQSEEMLRLWAKDPKVRAIGEIGLDYFYDEPDRETQRRVFERQLVIAEELGLPVVVHDREAHGDCMEAIKKHPGLIGVFHCYSGSAEMARQLVDMGWYLSFTGAVTFKKARRAPEAVRACPIERIMLETDSPYLAPEPRRGLRNDSRRLGDIAAVIAQEKGLSLEETAAITLENGRRFFRIG